MKRESILIEAEELLKKLNQENIRIFDTTITDDAYREGHIPGSAYFDHEKFSDTESPYEYTILPADKLVDQIGATGIANDSEVIVYACGMLPYAARAWWVLRYAGHENVRILNGGLTAYINAGGIVEIEPRNYQPSIFKGNPRPDMFASKEDVLAAMKDSSISIVDTLPRESYEAAHITGSTSLSCMDLMQGMDYFLPDDHLASRLQEKSQYERIITYCGGGIAAAINAIAHVLIGQENVAVYDGSLFEWIAEGLPMTGNGKWAIWENNG